MKTLLNSILRLVTLSRNTPAIARLSRPERERRIKLAFSVALCVLGFSARLFADLNEGLVAYYPLNGNAYDASGNGHNGTFVNTPVVADRLGIPGGAFTFDGTITKYVIISNFTGFPSNAITVSFWIKTTDGSSSRWVFSYATGDNASQKDNLFTIGMPSTLQTYLPGEGPIQTGISANDGKWNQIVVTWRSSDGQFSLYKNGMSQYSTTASAGTPIEDGGCLVLGQEQDAIAGGFDPDQAFIGELDDVRIYNRALDNAEVMDLHLEGHLSISFSQVRVCWNSLTNKTYQIQYRTELSSGTWVNLGSAIPGNGSTQCTTDEIVGPQRFYRALPSP